MFGHFMYEAVIAAGEPVTDITIYLIDYQYDHGESLVQATCFVVPEDTPDALLQASISSNSVGFPK